MLGGASGGEDKTIDPIPEGAIHIERESPILGGDKKLREKLFLEYVGGDIRLMIDKGTETPVQVSHICSTTQDNQTTFSLRVRRGKSASENLCLGTIQVQDIAPAPSGGPQIKVTLAVTQDANIHLYAIDTNPAHAIKLQRS
ncbi:MAG: Hsp70 family protein [Kiritimatiellia bacterium]|jgi:molecular chaperone DnaK (HSP70)